MEGSETDCEEDYYGEECEVTYLKDSKREPSLNTFIQQYNLDTVTSSSNMMSSFSNDPVLAEAVNEVICSNITEENLSDYSRSQQVENLPFTPIDITLKPLSNMKFLNSEIESQSFIPQIVSKSSVQITYEAKQELNNQKRPITHTTANPIPSTSNNTALKNKCLTQYSPASETKTQEQTTTTVATHQKLIFSVPSLSRLSLMAISNITKSTESNDCVYKPPPCHPFNDPCDGDFSPDDDSDYQPNLNDVPNDEDADDAVKEPKAKRKRTKKEKAGKENCIYKKNKIKRMKGENYSGRRKNEDGKSVFDVERNSRSIHSRCDHSDRCKFFECHKLTENKRKILFDNYWGMSWDDKKTYVRQTVRKQEVFKRKCSDNNFRRNNTFKYSFRLSGETVKVCKKMYLNTLNVGEWSVHNWTRPIENKKCGVEPARRNEIARVFNDFGKNYVIEFLESLPKLESHYCRKSTSKLYLEEVWQSKQQLYREYVKQLLETERQEYKVSTTVFFEIFEAKNLSLFSPKKDQCDLCCSYKVGNITEEIYQAHIQKKNRAREEKDKDKKDISNPNTKVYTFDLQAVLLAPALKASALYYKTKLKVHNFTIYDIKTGEAFCYIWNESEGGLSADEFSSILRKFIEDHVPKDTNHVIFWSDGCTFQNRNSILANALLLTAVQKNMTITQKYLVKGHTQMEADSMHSTIERQLRNRDIYCPAQYIDVCQTARLKKPYVVSYLDHRAFQKYSSMPYLKSIRPGERRGEATVFDLQAIQYKADGTIFVKTDFDAEFEALPKRIKKPNTTDTMRPLHDTRIPITRQKYKHLQELKQVLPQDVHPFYDQLPHECPDRVKNRNDCSCRKNIST